MMLERVIVVTQLVFPLISGARLDEMCFRVVGGLPAGDVGRAIESDTEKLIATGPALPPATSMTP